MSNEEKVYLIEGPHSTLSKEEVKQSLKQAFDEIKILRKKIDSEKDFAAREAIITELTAKIEDLDTRVSQFNAQEDSVDEVHEEISQVDQQILDLQKELKTMSQEYEASYQKMQAIIDEQQRQLDSINGLFSDEDLQNIREEYAEKKLSENAKSVSIKSRIDSQQKHLAALKRRKNKMKRDVEASHEAGISVADVNEIQNVLKKKTVVDAIMNQKGLGKVVSKKASERTAEEKKAVREAKKEIESEVRAAKKEHKKEDILSLVEALYSLQVQYRKGRSPRILIIPDRQLDTIRVRVHNMPEKIIHIDEASADYVPGDIPADMQEVMESREPKVKKKFLMVKSNKGLCYVTSEAIDEFDLSVSDEAIFVDGNPFYQIRLEDAEKLLADSDDYEFEQRTVELDEQKENENDEVVDDTNHDVVEQVTVYQDSESNDYYVPKYALSRFHLKPKSEEVIIQGRACTRISDVDYDYILSHQDNGYSPYQVRTDTVDIEKNNSEEKTVVEPETPKKKEVILLYKGLNDENGTYASEEVLSRFGFDALGDVVPIEGNHCHAIDSVTEDGIQAAAKAVDIEVKYQHVLIEKKSNDPIVLTLYKDVNDNGQVYANIMDLVRLGFSIDGEVTTVEEIACHKINSVSEKEFIFRAEQSKDPIYSVDYRNVYLNKNNHFSGIQRVEVPIYHDLNDNNQPYATVELLTQLGLPINETVVIEGVECSSVSREDLNRIRDFVEQSTDPLQSIAYHDVMVTKKVEEITVTIYRDTNDNNQLYARRELLEQFGITPVGEITIIEGIDCYPVDATMNQSILDQVVTCRNPKYLLYYRDMALDHVEKLEAETIDIKLYHDIDHSQVYVPKEVLEQFGIKFEGNIFIIDGHDCCQISMDKHQQLLDKVNSSENPKYAIQYMPTDDLAIKEVHPKPHVETIINHITEGLEIKGKDVAYYRSSNLRPAKMFVNDLKSGNWIYNIVHVCPAVGKLTVGFATKLSGKLLLSETGKASMQEIERRLREELTDEEWEVLFDEYKGSVLKTDMNNQINDLILVGLKEYAYRKVENLNQGIKDSYLKLFAVVGSLREIEIELGRDDLAPEEEEKYFEIRKMLLSDGACYAKNILEYRKEANNLLSSGIHGIEEDFKAVSTKLSYVGMRFAKTNDFNNELQAKLAKYGQGLNDAIAKDDPEGIISNFIELESCYFQHTDIERDALGKRSIGFKYYSPLAEEFDYRNDPFISDCFFTGVVATTGVQVFHALKVNDQNNQILQELQQHTKSNQGTAFYGMRQQAHQDLLSASQIMENNGIVKHDFSSTYSQIQEITTRYASGAINQSQALNEMALVAEKTQATLVDVAKEALKTVTDTNAKESLQFIVSNPEAVVHLNNGFMDTLEYANGMAELSSLPSDIHTSLLGALGTATFAAQVASRMESKYGKKQGYGNEVTEGLEEMLKEGVPSFEEKAKKM